MNTACLTAGIAGILSGIDLFFRVTGSTIIKSGRVESDGLVALALKRIFDFKNR